MLSVKDTMQVAIGEAISARDRGDLCFGAVVTNPLGQIVADGGNRTRTKNNSASHVECEIMDYAKGQTKSKYLEGYTLFTTAEPCMMCLGHAYWIGIRKIFYGISQEDIEKYGTTLGYRRCPVGSVKISIAYNMGIDLVQTMREECLEALTNKES